MLFSSEHKCNQNHADKAISLALKLDRKSAAFREKMKSRGIQFGRTRIGVNSGPAVIGNFGGSSFFDYTAIGDNVNVAARLEGANKVTGGTICVSGETAKRAKEHFFRPVGLLYVYGRSNAVEAWEPVSKEEEKSPAFSLYRSAYESLEKGEGSARRSFQSLVDKYPNDHLARFHLNRLINGNANVEIELGK